MTETVQGLFIGAAAGLVPSFVTLALELLKERSRRKHELRLKHIDLVETKRLDALLAYSDLVGQFMGHSMSAEITSSDLMAAHQRFALYASPDTLTAMIAAYPLLLNGWNHYHDSDESSGHAAPDAPEILALTQCLRRELSSTIDEIADQRKPCKHLCHKKHDHDNHRD